MPCGVSARSSEIVVGEGRARQEAVGGSVRAAPFAAPRPPDAVCPPYEVPSAHRGTNDPPKTCRHVPRTRAASPLYPGHSVELQAGTPNRYQLKRTVKDGVAMTMDMTFAPIFGEERNVRPPALPSITQFAETTIEAIVTGNPFENLFTLHEPEVDDMTIVADDPNPRPAAGAILSRATIDMEFRRVTTRHREPVQHRSTFEPTLEPEVEESHLAALLTSFSGHYHRAHSRLSAVMVRLSGKAAPTAEPVGAAWLEARRLQFAGSNIDIAGLVAEQAIGAGVRRAS